MSMPNIPDIKPKIDINMEETINMLLSSIAMQDLGLSHIINAEAEKVQFVLGTLHNEETETEKYCIDDVLKVNKTVDRTLRGVLKNQIMSQLKLEDTLDLCDRFLGNDFGIECSPESEDS